MNSDWILAEYASPMHVTSSGDPAEVLARLARMHGCLTLDLIGTAITDLEDGEPTGRPVDQDTLALFAGMVEHAARAAFRFAIAAVDLDRRQRLEQQLAALEGRPTTDEEHDEPEPRYMQTLRELAKPWKPEVADE